MVGKLIVVFLFGVVPAGMGQEISQGESFKHEILKVQGDLNSDNIVDFILVSQDTINYKWPYRLQVYFGNAHGGHDLKAMTTTAIEAQFPDGKAGYMAGVRFSGIRVNNGTFTITNELIRGSFEHTFRYQNDRFELIRFSKVNSNGHGVITTIDFNLLTGIRVEKTEQYDTNRTINNKRKKILIMPLPGLQDFRPSENDLY